MTNQERLLEAARDYLLDKPSMIRDMVGPIEQKPCSEGVTNEAGKVEKKGKEEKAKDNGDKEKAENEKPSDANRKAPDFLMVKESKEYLRAKALHAVIKDYAKREKPSRPLCIAVFGPPGSGKSTIVKEILKLISSDIKRISEINLTQLLGPKPLLREVRESVRNWIPADMSIVANASEPATGNGDKPADGASIRQDFPVIFFDEFDAELGGERLGWLKYFLSIMQDGLPLDVGHTLKKAIFVFAGGTANSMQDFRVTNAQDITFYKKMKVPDFISRLHAFLDVQGINGAPNDRIVRRTLALKFLLAKRKNEIGRKPIIEVERELLNDLLLSSHFIHNQRSLAALLDVSVIKEEYDYERVCLPGQPYEADTDDLLRLHISRGALDGKLIGFSTWKKDNVQEFSERLSSELFLKGAAVAYGGDLEDRSVLTGFVRAAKDVPIGLLPRASEPIVNYLAYPSFLRHEVQEQIVRRKESDQEWIRFEQLPTLTEREMNYFDCKKNEYFPGRPDTSKGETYDARKHLAWSVSLFRMRLRMIQDVDALIVIGGKSSDSWGRASGIAEEVMIAQALKKPVYILGSARIPDDAVANGGAAGIVGRRLGLGEVNYIVPEVITKAGNPSYSDSQYLESLRSIFSECFRIPGADYSPVTEQEIMDTFNDHFVRGPGWIPNGLTVEENRTLFALKHDKDEERIKDLILKGLQKI